MKYIFTTVFLFLLILSTVSPMAAVTEIWQIFALPYSHDKDGNLQFLFKQENTNLVKIKIGEIKRDSTQEFSHQNLAATQELVKKTFAQSNSTSPIKCYSDKKLKTLTWILFFFDEQPPAGYR